MVWAATMAHRHMFRDRENAVQLILETTILTCHGGWANHIFKHAVCQCMCVIEMPRLHRCWQLQRTNQSALQICYLSSREDCFLRIFGAEDVCIGQLQLLIWVAAFSKGPQMSLNTLAIL